MFEQLQTGAEIGADFFKDFNFPIEINQNHIHKLAVLHYYSLSYKGYKNLSKSLELSRAKQVSAVREINEWKRKYNELFQGQLRLKKELLLSKEQYHNAEEELHNLKMGAEIFQTQYNELQKRYHDLINQGQPAMQVSPWVPSYTVDRDHITNNHAELYYSYRAPMTVVPSQAEYQDSDDYKNIVDSLKKLAIRQKKFATRQAAIKSKSLKY